MIIPIYELFSCIFFIQLSQEMGFSYVFLCALLFRLSTSIIQVAPTWITSNYLQADSKKVINGDVTGTTVGNASTPTATIPFTTAFGAVPNLGYGISNYQGNDNLGSEMFQVNRTGLTTSAFSVLVQISGNTNIWVLEVRFIAISKAFPHHLNSFDNVPINYNNGALTNITVASMSVKTYTNTINYAAQAAATGSTYTAFSLPLTNNKILLFMTSLFHAGTNEASGAGVTLYPINLYVTATPASTTTYTMTATFSINAAITRLHFSMITFDQADVQASGMYMLVYDRPCYPTAGGYYSFPSQFLTNFMIGFAQFSSNKTASLIHFINNFVTVSGDHRVSMPASAPRNTSRNPLVRFCFTMFYLKTWICPNQTFFDPSLNLCTGCPIINCIDCYNLTVCMICNEAAGYFLNSTSGLCETCAIAGCTNCTSNTTCVTCNTGLNYVLTVGQSCQLCNSAANYFANPSTHTCDLCAISNCLTCSSLTTCQTCNNATGYYKNPSGTCSYCDPAQNSFIDPVTFDCDVCALVECINCSSLATCRECNETNNYFLGGDNLCHACTPTHCLDCLNVSACSVCDSLAGYTINPTTLLCEICPLVGCITCTDTQTCTLCNITANYVLLSNNTCQLCTAPIDYANTTSGQCEPCAVSNCLVCATLTTCQVCDTNSSYYLLGNLTCGYCDPLLNNFINSTTLGCQACSIPNCLTCSSLTSCLTCNETAQYFPNTTDSLCNLCTPTNCLDCYNMTTCNICNTAAGYILNSSGLCDLCPTGLFPNTSSNLCEPCAVANCAVCSALTVCQTCDFNGSWYLLGNFTCGYCDNLVDNFINLTNLGCQTCSIPYCTDCSSLTTCQTCNGTALYLFNSTDFLCYPCTLSDCILCNNFTTCTLCNETTQHFLNYTSELCQPCALTGCLNCSSLYTCNQCDTNNSYGFDFTSPNMSLCGDCNVSCICDGYGMPWDPIAQACTAICGDGLIRVGEECDDNNTDSYDGCSSSCVVEPYYVCDGAEPTHCNQTLYIEAQFLAIAKQGCNGFKITVNVPRLTYDQVSQNIHIINSGISVTRTAQNGSSIQIYAEYTRDIANETIQLHFSPGDILNITYSPTIPALYYSPQECSASTQVEKLLQAAQIISYAILIVSILSCKIVGLELFGVLQLSYFTLSSHSFLNVYLAPLTQFRTFNGLNVGITSETSQVPDNYSKMGVAGTFINNCNVMLFVLFGQLLIALTMYIISKIIRKDKVQKLALRLLKQGFVTLVLFNIFNIAFSAGVHWKYASPSDEGYVISSLILYGTLIAMVVSVAAMELTAKEDYGEFKNKFKGVWICQLYIPLTVVYRMILGFYSAVKSDYDESTLIILGFSLAFMLYTIVNLPFTNVYQNYRCSLIHITMLYTLLTTNYYRSMKSTTPIQVKGRIYTPAIIELILMVTCIGVSFAVLAYEIYQMIRQWRSQKKTENKGVDRQDRHVTEESFDNL